MITLKNLSSFLAKEKSEPFSSEKAFAYFAGGAKVRSLDIVYSDFISSLMKDIESESFKHTSYLLRIPKWIGSGYEEKLKKDITERGFTILYSDNLQILISWRQ